MRLSHAALAAIIAFTLLIAALPAPGAEMFASHPPMRPLPVPSQRPLADAPARFVDAARGDDAADGSQARPWKSIAYALRQVQPGEVLYLRGGTYYEHVIVPHSGVPERPITLRGYPGELAVIDGGLREFSEEPASAWQPLAGGAAGEYVSTRTYPQFAERPVLNAFLANGWEPFYGKEDERPVVLGNFGDSMVPLHGYRTLGDLRDDSMLRDGSNKVGDEGFYCGPGLWFNRDTRRIHVRLAHCTLDGLGSHAYRGQTDPRKLPLCISGPCGADVLRINGIRHFRVQDVVLRGASGSPLANLYGSEDIAFDGVTFYGGAPSLLAKASHGLRIFDCAMRSLAAPWSSRASMKYRGTPSYIIITDENQPLNADWEIAYSEFTDGHDFAWFRNVNNLRFHHNYVDNFNDDGFEVGAKKRDHELYCYQNLFTRCQHVFALHEMHQDESPAEVNPGSGVYIARNVIDLRRGVMYGPPKEPDPSGSYLDNDCELAGDHGGPRWPQYYFYHNTVIRKLPTWRGYYAFGIGGRGTRETRKHIFNNIFVQLAGLPGILMPATPPGMELDANLYWSVAEGPQQPADLLARLRAVASRKNPYPSEWMKHDLMADPKLVALGLDPDGPIDLRLRKGSPAIDAGVPVPGDWIDPVREADAGKPDIGAFPLGIKPWQIGVGGRMSVFGGS